MALIRKFQFGTVAPMSIICEFLPIYTGSCPRLTQLYSPPFAERTDPVVHRASSVQRKATRGAISSTSAILAAAGVDSMRGCISFRNCSSLSFHWSNRRKKKQLAQNSNADAVKCEPRVSLRLTSSNRPGVDAVDSNVVRLPQLLGPDARQRLLGGLGGGVHGLPGDAEAGGGRRDEDDPAAPRDVRHDGLGQEYGPLDVGVKVRLVELLRDLVEVGVVAERGAARRVI